MTYLCLEKSGLLTQMDGADQGDDQHTPFIHDDESLKTVVYIGGILNRQAWCLNHENYVRRGLRRYMKVRMRPKHWSGESRQGGGDIQHTEGRRVEVEELTDSNVTTNPLNIFKMDGVDRIPMTV